MASFGHPHNWKSRINTQHKLCLYLLERSRCYSHTVGHCSTWCVFLKKKQFVTEPSQEKIEECWTELFRMEVICSGHLAQPPSHSFLIFLLLLSHGDLASPQLHPFCWPESLGSRIKCFLPVFRFPVSYKASLTGQPPSSAHNSTLHPTPVWVAGRICLSVSWMNNWIGSSSKSHHPTAAMSF